MTIAFTSLLIADPTSTEELFWNPSDAEIDAALDALDAEETAQ